MSVLCRGLQMPHRHMACPGVPTGRSCSAPWGRASSHPGGPGGAAGTGAGLGPGAPSHPHPALQTLRGTSGFAAGEQPCPETPPRASTQPTVTNQPGVEENIRQTSAGCWERMQKRAKNRNGSAAARGGAIGEGQRHRALPGEQLPRQRLSCSGKRVSQAMPALLPHSFQQSVQITGINQIIPTAPFTPGTRVLRRCRPRARPGRGTQPAPNEHFSSIELKLMRIHNDS